MEWEVGDFALCVNNVVENPLYDLKVGEIYKVRQVIVGKNCNGEVGAGLNFAGITPPFPYKGYWAKDFQKIKPDEHEPCEEEFVALLNNIRIRENA